MLALEYGASLSTSVPHFIARLAAFRAMLLCDTNSSRSFKTFSTRACEYKRVNTNVSPHACVVTSLLSPDEAFRRKYNKKSSHALDTTSSSLAALPAPPFFPQGVSYCTCIVYMHTCVVFEGIPCYCYYSELLFVLSSRV